ncbi:hypothetical protein [Plantactinospora endophytica]|uniref:Ig-like domain-containing protein n=1 Tax=Plantactinospora endophytica TaxID=673535 RepID=A0ABQ4DT31_9ACTN|nr:hypothetical protein [Plantactinospora endophytica]GIG85616.1 hypothetical protein Pen02_05520 [Plantactinospora endophytica]
MTNDLHPDLVRLGNELEHAVGREIAAGRRSGSRRLFGSRAAFLGTITAGVLAVGGGAAFAAVALLSPDTVSRGMPGAAAIFQGTDPTCTTEDNVVFTCTLDRAPHDPLPDLSKIPEAKRPRVPIVRDFTDRKEAFTDERGNVAGGCVGEDAAGLRWTCYAGQRAVDEGILGEGLLGEHLPTPARG